MPKPAPRKTAAGAAGIVPVSAGWHVEPGRRLVGHLPTFHSYANACAEAFWLGGGCVVYPSPAYSPAATLDAIEKEKCTGQ